ncbi:hypothetical protein F511_22779 [Dorcoceras hygrometricum]|uniref:Uncharacterized protein n=1 Tax=Dorcoceras hygrometricum TaxID=472368 RepID=A0A2Z7AHT6_9LAMI|nr:hypothetical protein F511_22779 [Dorcoceras hygrometricum]
MLLDALTMIRWASPGLRFRSHNGCGPTASCIPEPLRVTQVLDSRFPHGYSAQCVEHEKRILGSATSKSQQRSNRDLPMLRGKTIHQFLKEPLRSGDDDDISGVEQPSKIINMEEDSVKNKETAGPWGYDSSVSRAHENKFGHGITITGVTDGDWYKANLPKIVVADNGKAPLVELDTVKGHPAREIFQLICGDIEFLVQLREKVIDEVTAFFNSFSLRRLAVLKSLKDIAANEEKVLTWGETDSVQIALQRRLYIVAKYRELLLRKFFAAHRANFSFGQPWSAMALQIIDLLSSAHSSSVKNLLTQKQALKLECTRPCCATLFEGANFDRGFYIPRKHKTIFSTCSVRNLRFIEGSWDTASRGLTTIATPKSQFQTYPSDHGKANRNLTPVDFRKSHSLNSSSYAQHIELNFHAGIMNPVLV